MECAVLVLRLNLEVLCLLAFLAHQLGHFRQVLTDRFLAVDNEARKLVDGRVVGARQKHFGFLILLLLVPQLVQSLLLLFRQRVEKKSVVLGR